MKRYRIREGSIAHYAIGFAPFVTLILIGSLCHLLTGTF